ncbi:MAG: thioredoxin [Candidatus Aureabacteria bacterium]|nr:thioredoxin [Candidatus Auribacterota bacterium]
MSQNVIEFTDANFQSEIKEGVTLVDFWATWCNPCRMQSPIIEKIAEKTAGKIKVGKCNVDDNQEVANQYGIFSIPTLVIFKNGEEVERMVGLQQENAISTKLDSYHG